MSSGGTNAWWQEVKGRCIQDGAGMTGVVILDGVAFTLPNHTRLPGMTIQPGAAMGAWTQNNSFSFTGYNDGGA